MKKSKAFTHNSYFKNKILNLIAKPERRHLHCQNSLSDSRTPDTGYFKFQTVKSGILLVCEKIDAGKDSNHFNSRLLNYLLQSRISFKYASTSESMKGKIVTIYCCSQCI